jgi:hypothetical protein
MNLISYDGKVLTEQEIWYHEARDGKLPLHLFTFAQNSRGIQKPQGWWCDFGGNSGSELLRVNRNVCYSHWNFRNKGKKAKKKQPPADPADWWKG